MLFFDTPAPLLTSTSLLFPYATHGRSTIAAPHEATAFPTSSRASGLKLHSVAPSLHKPYSGIEVAPLSNSHALPAPSAAMIPSSPFAWPPPETGVGLGMNP